MLGDDLSRRQFLDLSGKGALALATVGTGGFLLGGCDPGPLQPADANGLKLVADFTSRVIATTGVTVPGSSPAYSWHTNPDGGACFPLPDGGWSYVSNSESLAGGAGYVRFASDGTVVGAGSCLTGTAINCAGGATPWGTWLSCEEHGAGQVWECSPTGASAAVARPLMGKFTHEAAAADAANGCIYLTEDVSDGALYRFVPNAWGNLVAGELQVLTETAGTLAWVKVEDPDGSPVATRNQVPNTKRFNGGEGAAMSKGRLVFTTKGDGRVWLYDPTANALTIMYDDGVTPNGVLTNVDNAGTSELGTVYIAEDGPSTPQIVIVREDGATYPVVELTGVSGTEITGPAFDPSGTRLYFSSQRNPGRTFEVTGNWRLFTNPNAQ